MACLHAFPTTTLSNFFTGHDFVYKKAPIKVAEFFIAVTNIAVFCLSRQSANSFDQTCLQLPAAPLAGRLKILGDELSEAAKLYKLMHIGSCVGELINSSIWQGFFQNDIKNRFKELLRKDLEERVSNGQLSQDESNEKMQEFSLIVDQYVEYLLAEDKMKLRNTFLDKNDKIFKEYINIFYLTHAANKKASSFGISQRNLSKPTLSEVKHIARDFANVLKDRNGIKGAAHYILSVTDAHAEADAEESREQQKVSDLADRVFQAAQNKSTHPNLKKYYQHIVDLRELESRKAKKTATKVARVFFEVSFVVLRSYLDLLNVVQWANKKGITKLSSNLLSNGQAFAPWAGSALCVVSVVQSLWHFYDKAEKADWGIFAENIGRAALAFRMQDYVPVAYQEPAKLAIDLFRTAFGYHNISRKSAPTIA